MKSVKTVVALALFATLCVAADRPACGTGQSCLTEVLSGAVDGKNCRFFLSRVAEGGTPVQVYRNGVRLAAGDDYEASGNTITFTNREAPAPGDVLEAVYEPAARQLQPDRSAPRVPASATGEEISSALARQALSTELTGLSAPEPIAGKTGATSSVSSADTDPASAPSRSAAARHKKGERESQKAKKDISAHGVDGLGDNSLESDSTDVDNSDSSSTKVFHSALQLLERRLKPQRSGADSGEAPEKDAGNNPN